MAKEMVTGVVIRNRIWQWVTFKNAQGACQQVETGEVDTSVEDKGVLEGEIKEAFGNSKADLVIGMPLDQVLLRVVDLPVVDEDELASIVELQVDKFSPFPMENMVVSHEVLAKPEGAEVCPVLIAAVKRTAVEDMGRQLESAGVLPARVDASALGWWRLLRDEGEVQKEGRQVIVLMDAGSPEIVVVQDGVPIVFRSLGEIGEMSGEELVDETVREVGYTLMSLELEKGSVATSMISIWYSADVPGELAKRLRGECSCDVEMKQMESLPSLQEGLLRRTVATELHLNLVLEAWTQTEQSRAFKKRMMAAVMVLAGIWILGVGGLFGGLAYEKYSLSTLKAELEEVQGPADEVRSTQSRVRTLELYTDSSQSALTCLHELSRLCPVPNDAIVWKSYDYRKEKMVRFDGEAVSDAVLLEYNRNLSGSEVFTKVSLGNTIKDPRTGKTKFSMTLTLPGGEEETE